MKESKKTAHSGSVLIVALLIIGGIIGGSFISYKIIRPKLPIPLPKTETRTIQAPSLTPSPENNNSEETPSFSETHIKCLGADRKYSFVPKKVCDATRNFWTKVNGTFPTDPEEVIKCLGADGKYSYVPRITCENTNNFWANNNPPTVGNSTASSSTSSSSSSTSSSSSSSSSDTTAPTIPGTPEVATTYSASPTWSWTASTDDSSGLTNPAYTLQWSQDSGFASGVSSATSNTNSYTHSSALAIGNWYFRVLATDVAGNVSSYSSYGSAQVLPQNLLTNAGTQIEDFEASTDWVTGGVGVTVANDATNYKTGTRSVKLTVPQNITGIMGKTVSLDLSAIGSGAFSRVWVYLNNTPVNGTNYIFRFSSTTNWSKYFGFNTTNGLKKGWNHLNIASTDWANTGGESWSNTIIRMRVFLATPAGGGTQLISVDDFRVGVTSIPVALLSLSDGRSSAYDIGFAYTNPLKFRMSERVPTGTIGDAGKLTIAQLLEMEAAGWSITNHTRNGVSLTTEDLATQITAIQGGYDDLVAAGLNATNARFVAYPQGVYNDDTLTAMAATSPTMLVGHGLTIDSEYPTLPYPEVYQNGPKTGQLIVPSDLATVKGWLDSAKVRGEIFAGGWDNLADSPGGGEWSSADFQAFIDYVIAQQVVPVTDGDLYALQSGPITVPIPW